MSKRRNDDGALSSVAVEVLLTLTEGPLHGYAIKRAIEERIGGDFMLGSGSMYQALQRLERREFVSEHETGYREDRRRGRVYRIEPAGKAALATEVTRMKRVLRHAQHAAPGTR